MGNIKEIDPEYNTAGSAGGDYIIRATAAEDHIRAFAITCRNTVEDARRRHNMTPVVSAALGRTMAAALMMGIDLKNDTDIMTIQYECDGPVGGMTVTADSKGHVKGYAYEPDVMLPLKENGKLDVGGAVGGGTLHVMKDIGLKDTYNGSVEIQTGEIAEDIAYYFAVSEQVPSAVSLGVLVDPSDGHILEAGGFIIQLMPDCPEDIAEALEKSISEMPGITTLLTDGTDPEKILETVLGQFGLRINDKTPVCFRCDCSRTRVEKALIAMGDVELASLIKEGEPVTLTCSFCSTGYTFSIEELKTIRDSMKGDHDV